MEITFTEQRKSDIVGMFFNMLQQLICVNNNMGVVYFLLGKFRKCETYLSKGLLSRIDELES
jgi:hypothetical protein